VVVKAHIVCLWEPQANKRTVGCLNLEGLFVCYQFSIFGLVGLCRLGLGFPGYSAIVFQMDFISSGVASLDLPFRLGSEVINCLNSSKKSSRLLGSLILH
jgi:hypothetical protein